MFAQYSFVNIWQQRAVVVFSLRGGVGVGQVAEASAPVWLGAAERCVGTASVAGGSRVRGEGAFRDRCPAGLRSEAERLAPGTVFVPCAVCRAAVDLADVSPLPNAVVLCATHRSLGGEMTSFALIETPWRPLRVLLVDDSDAIAVLVGELLVGDEFELVGHGADGSAVTHFIAQTSPDLLLIDLHMPRLNGIEATRQIRAAGLRLPVVMLTASDEYEQLAAAFAAGVTGFLRKLDLARQLLPTLRSLTETSCAAL